MSALWKIYQNALTKRPILVQAVQAGMLMFTGDFIAQTFVERRQIRDVSLKRSLRFGSIGFFVVGPFVRTWYGILYKYVGSKGKSVAVKKVLLDQLVFAPTFIVIFLTIIGTVRGDRVDSTLLNIKRDYPDILVSNWCLWPWVQLLNFYWTPLQYQVLVVQLVSLFWNTYLSWKTNRAISVPALK